MVHNFFLFTDIESKKLQYTAANDMYILEIDLCYVLQIKVNIT